MIQLVPQPISLFNFIAADIDDARHFLDRFLPAPIRRCCDLNTLCLQGSHIIDDTLSGQLADLLYSLNTVRGTGYIHCVQDLQSRPEKMMPLRMYRYSLTIMQRHIEQGNNKFPVVLPLLFYHGQTPANPYSTRLPDFFAQTGLGEAAYMEVYPLVDIRAMPIHEVAPLNRRDELFALLDKHAQGHDPQALDDDINRVLSHWSLPPAQFRKIIYNLVDLFRAGNGRQDF